MSRPRRNPELWDYSRNHKCIDCVSHNGAGRVESLQPSENYGWTDDDDKHMPLCMDHFHNRMKFLEKLSDEYLRLISKRKAAG